MTQNVSIVIVPPPTKSFVLFSPPTLSPPSTDAKTREKITGVAGYLKFHSQPVPFAVCRGEVGCGWDSWSG